MKMGPNSFVRLSFLLRRAFLKDFMRWTAGANPEMTAGELVEGELAELRLKKIVATQSDALFRVPGEKIRRRGQSRREKKLTPAQTQRLLFLSRSLSNAELAKRFSVSATTVQRILQTRSEIRVPVSRPSRKSKPESSLF